MERVLITGASGFVGFHLVNEALKNNLEVYAAVRKSSDIRHLRELGIQFTYLNFNNLESLVKELEDKQYSYIVHAAGATAAKTQADYNHVNADYTYNLALAATKANIKLKKFVFLSSLAALGPLQDTGSIIHDDTTPNPVTAYGKSKLLAEEQLNQLPSLPLIILRPTAVYGPRDKDIFIILKKFSQGLEPYIGNIPQKLSFVYVKDLAKVTVSSLFSAIANKTYNISDGRAYDRYALANYSKQILNKKTLKIHLPLSIVRALAGFLEKVYANSKFTPALNIEKLNELTAPNWVCDIEHARQDLGYQPGHDLLTGLTESFQWYRANHWI
ncbi:NAD-dependent epimerase/dehydratase family protein [Mucilaginibacter rivuli]|uniref:NAD-dependent epimerase/dehydratase family protein n=1 Tax=Mucilaginibacter rivuli TaxID=2857527 RepID=UPI002104F8FA|nr:NAD(P)-dependent oxidoreductase [Mucilaginibacter rivuli]